MTRSRRPFFALAMAEIFSLSGTRLSMVAIPWLVLTTTSDAFLTGVVVFAEMLPYVIAKAMGGPFIDRLGARTISIAGDLGSVVAVALVPVLHMFDALSITALLPIVFVMGAMRGPAEAAKMALVPAVAESAGLPLERVTGVTGTIERLASTIGAAAAGALVALLGPASALAFNVVTLGAAALVMLVGIDRSISAKTEDAENNPEGYWRQWAVGWNFLRRDSVLVGIVFMVAITNFVDQANVSVLMPVWAQITGQGAAVLGLLFATFSGFSVLGSVLATGLAERLPRLVVFATAFLITGFPRFLVLMLDVPLFAVLATIATAGFAAGFLNPILSAVIFERIPKPLVGRVNSLVTALCFTLMPIGGLAAGAMISAFGPNVTLATAAAIYFAVTMLPLTLKSFRAFAVRPEPQTNQPGQA